METDPCSDDLHLVLDTSTDASDNKDATGSESEGPSFASPKPPPPKSSGIQAKSSDGKRIQITTLSTLSSPTANKTNAQPSAVKSPAASGIQVKSLDGKPLKTQIKTLASYTSPKSKSQSQPHSTSEDLGKGDNSKTLKSVENTFSSKISTSNEQKVKSSKVSEGAKSVELIDLTADEKGDKSTVSVQKGNQSSVSSPSTPKGSTEGKPAPKRAQFTTIQLFNTSNKGDK